MIELHPEAGQDVQAFANDMCWIAHRTDTTIFGYFNGTFLIALEDSRPDEVVGDYWRKQCKEHGNAAI